MGRSAWVRRGDSQYWSTWRGMSLVKVRDDGVQRRLHLLRRSRERVATSGSTPSTSMRTSSTASSTCTWRITVVRMPSPEVVRLELSWRAPSVRRRRNHATCATTTANRTPSSTSVVGRRDLVKSAHRTPMRREERRGHDNRCAVMGHSSTPRRACPRPKLLRTDALRYGRARAASRIPPRARGRRRGAKKKRPEGTKKNIGSFCPFTVPHSTN